MKIDVNKIPIQVLGIMQKLNNANYEAFLCGGAVRDLIMNKQPHDYDICTFATSEEIISTFQGYNIIPTGLAHGTVTIINDGMSIETTTFRSDGIYSDSRHPDSVTFVKSLKEDMARRDFTINALAMDSKGNVIDYFNGLDDIERRIIRCVGDATTRYNEDALRLMRCIRFVVQLNFKTSMGTGYPLFDLADNLQYIAIERIREEFNKILISDNMKKGIDLLVNTRLMKYIIPEIYDCVGFDQNNIHHDKKVYDHLIVTAENTINKVPNRLAGLLHDIGKPCSYSVGEDGMGHFYEHHIVSADMTRKILTRMKYDNDTIDKVCILVKHHMDRYPNLRKQSIKKFINKVGKDNLDDLFDLMIADTKASKPPFSFEFLNTLKNEVYRILNEKEPLTVKDLAINGDDLIEIGYVPGKELGNMLKYLLERVLEHPEWDTKEKLIKMATLPDVGY